EEVIISRLYDLQRYVSSHMNTDLGKGVPLEHSYNRDLQTWQESLYGVASTGENIYKKAQEICAPQLSSYCNAYLLCTTSELAKYPAASEQVDTDTKPHPEAYIHSFSSPVRSPDFAGWSILLGGVVILMILIRLISLGVLRLLLSRHYKRI